MNYYIDHNNVMKEYKVLSNEFVNINELCPFRDDLVLRLRNTSKYFDVVINWKRDTEIIYQKIHNSQNDSYSLLMFRVLKDYVLPIRYRGLPECCIISQFLKRNIIMENGDIIPCETLGRWSFIYGNHSILSVNESENFNVFWKIIDKDLKDDESL